MKEVTINVDFLTMAFAISCAKTQDEIGREPTDYEREFITSVCASTVHFVFDSPEIVKFVQLFRESDFNPEDLDKILDSLKEDNDEN